MNRREFLRYSSLLTAYGVCPSLLAGAGKQNNILILIELKGGNDGLNTLVPYRDPLYQDFRLKLRLGESEVLPLTENLALHNSLAFLRKQFDQKKLAIFQSVGYQDPNLSHFRSIDIWETASPSDEFYSEGWISNALAKGKFQESISRGVVLGDFNLGPLRGSTSNVLVIDDPAKMTKSGGLISAADNAVKNQSLNHILEVENQLNSALQKIAAKTKSQSTQAIKNKGGKFLRDVNVLLQILAVDSNVPFFKLSLAGFDTHINQKGKHANLLKQLDSGIEKLYAGLQQLGLWNNALILTYSEFGRRPRENANGGTDHGTANCQFALGGKVRGDLYGNGYDLKNLQDANLAASMDFKQIYQTVLSQWWGSPKNSFLGQKAINFLT